MSSDDVLTQAAQRPVDRNVMDAIVVEAWTPFGAGSPVLQQRRARMAKAAVDALISAGLVRTPVQALDRETLGQKVRQVWIDWASEQPDPKASWLVPWEGLSGPDREVDRRIGEELAAIGAASVRSPVTAEQIKAASDALLPVLGNPDGLAALSTLIGTRKLVDRAVRAVIATLGLSVAEGGDHGQ